jgi:hypothetical protein
LRGRPQKKDEQQPPLRRLPDGASLQVELSSTFQSGAPPYHQSGPQGDPPIGSRGLIAAGVEKHLGW